MVLIGHQTEIVVGDRKVRTLADILPESGPMRMLIVGKTPAPVSVRAGHYFQGRHGRLFWGQMKEYGLLTVPAGCYEDDVLTEHGYGITDVVKRPHEYGDEPTDYEYLSGMPRVLEVVRELRPRVVLFVYKGVLDKSLELHCSRTSKSCYGFNDWLNPKVEARVFACPLPGVGRCKRDCIREAMVALKRELTQD